MGDKSKLAAAMEKAGKAGTNVGLLSEIATPVEGLSTDNVALDWACDTLGTGGVPRARITELFGPQSCGKTTTALQAAARAQRLGMTVAYWDFEHTLDEPYAQALGVDTTNPDLFLVAQPDSLDEGAHAANLVVDTGEVGLIIFDSVAAMIPKAVIDADYGDLKVPGLVKAQKMAEFVGPLVGRLTRTGCTAIFLNHVMEVVNSGQKSFGPPPKTTPGGRALKYYASLRIEFTPSLAQLTETGYNELTGESDKIATAQKVWAKVVKNKVGVPFRNVELRSRFGTGFSGGWNAMNVLVSRGIVKEANGWYRIPAPLDDPELFRRSDAKKWPDHPGSIQGEMSLALALDGNPALLEKWEFLARECLRTQPDVLEVPEVQEEVSDDEIANILGF